MKRTFALALILLAATPALAEPPAKGPNGETLVTLHCKDESPTAAARLLSEQSGISLKTEPETLWTNPTAKNKPPAVTIDLDGRTFCEALQQLCLQTRTLPRPDGDGKALILAPDSSNSFDRPICPAGPFLIFADGFLITDTLGFANRKDPVRIGSLNVSILAEPGVQVIASSRQLQITEATDAEGHVFLNRSHSDTGVPVRRGVINRTLRYSTAVPLDFAEALPAKFKTVKGTYVYSIATATLPIEIDDITKPATKTAGDYTLALKECKFTGGVCQLAISGSFSDPAKNDPRTNILSEVIATARLYDGDGHTFAALNVSGAVTSGHYEAQLFFPSPDTAVKPLRLVIEIPTATKDVTMPVEFHDLELP